MKRTIALLCMLALLIPCALAEETLNILRLADDFYLMDEARLQSAEEQLAKTFLGMKVVTRQAVHVDYDEFSGDAQGNVKLKNADIYDLIAPDLERLIQADALVCLSGEEGMRTLLSSLPDFGALWAKDGKVYALPTRLHIMLAKTDHESKLKVLNLNPGDNWTWAQVFAAVPLLQESNQKNGAAVKLLRENQPLPLCLKQFFWQETLSPASLEARTQQLTGLLQNYKALMEAGLLAGEGENALITLNYTAFDGYMDAHYVLPPAFVSGGKSTMLSAEMMVVSREAKNKQAAFAWLNAIFSEEAIAQSDSYWHHGVLLSSTQATLNAATESSLTLWRQAVAQGYPDAPKPQIFGVENLWQQYAEGTLSLENCVEQMLALLPAAE